MKRNPSNLPHASYIAGKRALDKLKIPYKEQSNGTLLVEEDINLSHKGLKKLPDLSCVILTENFNCSYNQLTSLEGAPQSVGGNFWCENNQLTSLKGAPQSVGRIFNCSHNQLTSLKGAPQSVGGHFWCQNNQLTSLEESPQSVGRDFLCTNNQLTSLESAPQSVGGDFWCQNNKLTSLKGAPQTVRGDFSCHNNKLTSLEESPQSVGGDFRCYENNLISLEMAPKNFKTLKSDFGKFFSWNAVPENLRISPKTREREKKQKAMKIFIKASKRYQTNIQKLKKTKRPSPFQKHRKRKPS